MEYRPLGSDRRSADEGIAEARGFSNAREMRAFYESRGEYPGGHAIERRGLQVRDSHAEDLRKAAEISTASGQDDGSLGRLLTFLRESA